MSKFVYMDNAATTKVNPKVVDKMVPFFTTGYGNPSSVYSFSELALDAIQESKEIIAKAINAKAEEIYFTAGGTEADNWALKATAELLQKKGKHIITTNIEHHAILHTCAYLEKQGFEITYLPVDDKGFGEVTSRHKVYFHTDAVQAFGAVDIDVEDMHIDMLSASGHKLHGPKGIGFLYIKKGVKIKSFIHGGSQERRRRAGTENVPAIVGLGEAVRLLEENKNQRRQDLIQLRDYLIHKIESSIDHCWLNGDKLQRLPNNVNFSFEFIEGESMLILLDGAGICASSGSACTSGSLDPSHVLLAIGLPHEKAHGSLRLTISEETTKEDVDYVVEVLGPIIERLRKMSPLYEDYLRKQNKE